MKGALWITVENFLAARTRRPPLFPKARPRGSAISREGGPIQFGHKISSGLPLRAASSTREHRRYCEMAAISDVYLPLPHLVSTSFSDGLSCGPTKSSQGAVQPFRILHQLRLQRGFNTADAGREVPGIPDGSAWRLQGIPSHQRGGLRPSEGSLRSVGTSSLDTQ